MSVELTLEMAPFAVADGTRVEQLIEASERLERDFLGKAPGYLGRVLVQADSGKWADLVFWRSREHASKAMEAASSSAACRAYFACMAPEDAGDPANGVALYRAVKTFGRVLPHP